MTKVINLWGGPGIGKSTIAADLFAKMKIKKYSVELINEYAKQLTWDGHYEILKDQLYVSAKQNRKLERLMGKIDYIITDSPLLLCSAYVPDDYPKSFNVFMKDMNDRYDNIDILLKRKISHYDNTGRTQDIEQAVDIDNTIKQLFVDNNLDFDLVLNSDGNAANTIIESNLIE